MMEIIVPDDISPPRPIAPGVDCSGVSSFQGHVMNLVELKNVLISFQIDSLMWRIVDKVVCNAIPHTINDDCILPGLKPRAVVVNVIVGGKIAT
jgi:hypothetical protein